METVDEEKMADQEIERLGHSVEQRALWKAAREGDSKTLKAMLSAGANPDIPEPTDGGAYPVHRACMRETDECLRALLDAGASLDRRNDEGDAPIHFACFDIDSMMAKHFPPREPADNSARPLSLLIRLGANVRDRNDGGYEPLHSVASCGFEFGARELLKAGASPSALDNNGRLPERIAEEMDEGRLSPLLKAAREAEELAGLSIGRPSAQRKGL